LDTIC
jgi:bromodomain-containing factor 1